MGTWQLSAMSSRLPRRSRSAGEYWTKLVQREDQISAVPRGRWDAEAWREKIYVGEGGFVDGLPDTFDHKHFGITLLEARAMDPQQRVLRWQAAP